MVKNNSRNNRANELVLTSTVIESSQGLLGYRNNVNIGIDDDCNSYYHSDVFYMDSGLPMLRPTLHSLVLFDQLSTVNQYIMPPETESCFTTTATSSPSSPQQKRHDNNCNNNREKLREIIDEALALCSSM